MEKYSPVARSREGLYFRSYVKREIENFRRFHDNHNKHFSQLLLKSSCMVLFFLQPLKGIHILFEKNLSDIVKGNLFYFQIISFFISQQEKGKMAFYMYILINAVE